MKQVVLTLVMAVFLAAPVMAGDIATVGTGGFALVGGSTGSASYLGGGGWTATVNFAAYTDGAVFRYVYEIINDAANSVAETFNSYSVFASAFDAVGLGTHGNVTGGLPAGDGGTGVAPTETASTFLKTPININFGGLGLDPADNAVVYWESPQPPHRVTSQIFNGGGSSVETVIGPVPEPATAGLLLVGAGGLALVGAVRRKISL